MDSAADPNLLLTCDSDQFDIIIQELSTGEILNTISELHQETSRVQQTMTDIQTKIKSLLPKDVENSSEQYNTLIEELKNSQGLLAKLIDKSMKCFAQHKERKLLEKEMEEPRSNLTLKTESHINTISKPEHSRDPTLLNHSLNKTDDSEPKLVSIKSSELLAEKNPVVAVLPSNGISHNELETRTSLVKKSPNINSSETSGKNMGRKLIQEYSVKTPMDDIRAEIFKNVDKAAKENVSKLLVNNVVNLHNQDVKRHMKDSNTVKAEIRNEIATEENAMKGKIIAHQNRHKDTQNISNIMVKQQEAQIEPFRIDDAKIEVVQNKVKAPIVTGFDSSNIKNKDNSKISVTEVTISSSSTDRSPEPSSDSNTISSTQMSLFRVQKEEKISSKDMLASAKMLEMFLQDKHGGAVSGNPPVKNFKIRDKETKSLDAAKNDATAALKEHESHSLSTVKNQNVVEGNLQSESDVNDKILNEEAKNDDEKGEENQ